MCCDARLGFYYHHCAKVSGVIELAGFPIRHPNASVGCRDPWQITLVQSVAGRELDEIRHRSANKVRMRRFGVEPAINIGFCDMAQIINVITINTGAMSFVLTDNLKSANRSAVSFPTTGYAR